LGNFAFNQRLPGQYRDAETGLFYNYFRDYDPQTGRYVQSDPIGLAGGINPYAYVRSNPLRWSDRLGLQAAARGVRPWNGGGPLWGGPSRPRDPNDFEDQLFPGAGKKPGVKLPEWLRRPWFASDSSDEETEQCPVPIPDDPTKPPGPEWEWRPKGSQPGVDLGGWYNPGTRESLSPDLGHPPPIEPHWDYVDRRGRHWRVDPATGTMRPSK
jgi:RHS repeat-associated protein